MAKWSNSAYTITADVLYVEPWDVLKPPVTGGFLKDFLWREKPLTAWLGAYKRLSALLITESTPPPPATWLGVSKKVNNGS